MIARSLLLAAAFALTVLTAWLLPRGSAPPDRFAIAQQLIADGRAHEAVYLLDDPVWRGIAEYRAGRFGRAAAELRSDDDVLRTYNLGNAYAQLHEWESARAAYGRVLRIDPGHADARFNLSLVVEAEEAEKALAEAERSEARASRRNDEDRREPGRGNEGGERKEEGDAQDGELQSAARASDRAGRSPEAGLEGEQQLSTASQAGASGGAPREGEARENLTGAGAALLRRESTQAAEILLNRIRDNPARVLAARLAAIHERRRKGLE